MKENSGIKIRKGYIKQPAPAAEKNAKFHLSQQKANQNIVQIVTKTLGQETVINFKNNFLRVELVGVILA